MLGKRVWLIRLIELNRLNWLMRLIYVARWIWRLGGSADFNDLDNSAASICLINLTNAGRATNVTNKFDIKMYLCL